jgi:hypothetical protein
LLYSGELTSKLILNGKNTKAGQNWFCLFYLLLICIYLQVRHERTFNIKSVRNCTEDEGRPLGVGLQEQASNHLKLRW